MSSLPGDRSNFFAPPQRRPDWLRVKVEEGPNYREVKKLLRTLSLHTVCEEAGCPNIYGCFEQKTATFLILGDRCSRNCRFCRVAPGNPAGEIDHDEPANVERAVKALGLKFAVITSVTRDDLPDGGAAHFAATVHQIKNQTADCGTEVLIPDFQGDSAALATVVNSAPHILNHNVETVPRLYSKVRPQANYLRSLTLLAEAKRLSRADSIGLLTKSSIMVGLGEKYEEAIETARDLRKASCDIITVGQYLAPSRTHIPVERFWTPEEFAMLRDDLSYLGFLHVEAGPLVRSSYRAGAIASEAAGSSS